MAKLITAELEWLAGAQTSTETKIVSGAKFELPPSYVVSILAPPMPGPTMITPEFSDTNNPNTFFPVAFIDYNGGSPEYIQWEMPTLSPTWLVPKDADRRRLVAAGYFRIRFGVPGDWTVAPTSGKGIVIFQEA